MTTAEATGRALKAAKLARTLEAVGCDAATARAMTLGEQANVAAAAGVRMPSGATWSVVCALLESKPADALVGLPL